ncbi:PREDICTED: uncharacterized protein LOC104825024 [Tarenaya hassleriana]|uniref:uncharacterized protein LOC104825024 n=1 Tax=Tarenaya hassleriana TaxID=28532 RepID=UPI00053C5374|nr:PREDICTED: uncharacterized protein LOC104825024 [Tarenaya hassleriana]
MKKSRTRHHKKPFRHRLYRLFLYILVIVSCVVLSLNPFPLLKFLAGFALHVPRVFASLLKTKLLFVITNVIVIALVRESKLFRSKPSSPSSGSCDSPSDEPDKPFKADLQEGIKKTDLDGGERTRESFHERKKLSPLPMEELNKRADDLISRINRQRRLEAWLL